ncbi:MAG TPA: Rieske 2Fe-2S domain-containing protein [Myxococcales bacterium]|nr:Rieske 2Fe-2S domain-containing protein [Myxococcales bacterium]
MPSLTRFFHPVLPSSALRRDRPAGVRIGGRTFALFRDASGAPAAVADLCPHRNASLSGAGRVCEGKLVCGYHGWSFDARGNGRCLSQPALQKCDTESFQVVERSGYLWLADRGVPESSLPSLGWEGFSLAGSFTHLFGCPLRVALDNFSEDEHFPTVHSLLGWDAAGLAQVEFSAGSFDDRTEVRYQGPQRRHPVLPIFGVQPGDRYVNEWVTRFDPVHAVFTFRWESPQGKPRPLGVRIAVFMVPETEATTRFHLFIFTSVAEGSILRLLLPVVHRAALFMARREVAADAAILRHVHTAESLEGLRLTKFDKPVIHNRRLLDALYFGRPPAAETAGALVSLLA